MELPIRKTLEYFDKYDYPLTAKELFFWSGKKPKLKKGFCFLPGRSTLAKLRQSREEYSKPKWEIAFKAVEKIKKINFVEAVFVTGSLAMNNCKKTDDIDLMIVTKPQTLWMVRLWISLLFRNNRRHPHNKTAPNLICPNLWLDTKNLTVHKESLYHAHEVLQAKCIFDRGGVYRKFLISNSWVKKYLPNAYKHRISNIKYQRYIEKTPKLFVIFNLIFYFIQYLYMKPKMTSEKVGLGYAYFHPAKIKNNV